MPIFPVEVISVLPMEISVVRTEKQKVFDRQKNSNESELPIIKILINSKFLNFL